MPKAKAATKLAVIHNVKPCGQCPWRRNSLQGWLGNTTPEQFLATAMDGEHRMPCHSQIDYERRDWEAQIERVSVCAGTRIFQANIGKLPRNRFLASLKLEPDHETVFSSPQEFLAHHKRKVSMPKQNREPIPEK